MRRATVIKATIESGIRKIQMFFNNRSDIREVTELAPPGVDASPVKDAVAVYAETATSGKSISLGVINKKQKAAPGEIRLYAVDAGGNEVFNVWLKKDGTLLMGDSTNPLAYINFLVKHTQLNASLQTQATGINANLTAIAAAINAIVPGSYTPIPVTIDITSAKTSKIKTN